MSRLSKNQLVIALLLTLFAYTWRIHRLYVPVAWVFDEIYHAYSAEMYALNDPRGYEWWHPVPQGLAFEWLHPPVEKLMMAASIHIFSHPFEPLSQTDPPLTPDVTFAWRFPTALCTSLTVLILVLTGTRMFSFPVGFMAGLFYAIDPLSFTHGRLGTSDGIFTFFSTWAFYRLYIFLAEYPGKPLKNLLWLGIITGLAFSTKFTGVFNIFWSGFFISMLFIWRGLLSEVKKRKADFNLTKYFTIIAIFGITVLGVYLFSYLQWWLQGHTWQQFYELHNQIIRYHVGLKATHPFSSHPFSWPVILKPVWVYTGNDELGNKLNIYSTGNRWTWWGGLAAVFYFCATLLLKCINALRAEKPETFLTKANLKILFLITIYGGMFLPWILSPRILFIYHYLPALPFLFMIEACLFIQLLTRIRGRIKFIA